MPPRLAHPDSPHAAQDKSGGLLTTRYERALADIGEETELWEQLRLHLPTPAAELRAQRDRLRLLRISVAATVRGYNHVRLCSRGAALAVPAPSSMDDISAPPCKT